MEKLAALVFAPLFILSFSVYGQSNPHAAALPKSFHVCCVVGDKTICADVISTGQGWTVKNDTGPDSSVTFEEFKDGRVKFTSITPGSSVVKFRGSMDEHGNGEGDVTVAVNGVEFKGSWQSKSLEGAANEGRSGVQASEKSGGQPRDSSSTTPSAEGISLDLRGKWAGQYGKTAYLDREATVVIRGELQGDYFVTFREGRGPFKEGQPFMRVKRDAETDRAQAEVANYGTGMMAMMGVVPLNTEMKPFRMTDPDHFRLGTATFARISLPQVNDILCEANNHNHVDAFYAFIRGMEAATASDYKTSFCWMMISAKQGNVKAQSAVGSWLVSGRGTEQNLPEAFKWGQAAANQGEWTAEMGLAQMYAAGVGVPQDSERAAFWKQRGERHKAEEEARKKARDQQARQTEELLGIAKVGAEILASEMMISPGCYADPNNGFQIESRRQGIESGSLNCDFIMPDLSPLASH